VGGFYRLVRACVSAPRFRSGLGEPAPALAAPTPVGVETQTRPGVRALSDLLARDDTGSDGATLGGCPQISLPEDVEHYDGDFIIHAEGESSGIHDLQSAT